MFKWLRERRRKKLLEQPFPDSVRKALERDVALWRALPPEAKPKIEDDLRVFTSEKSWEPCGGMRLTEERIAIISAQACVLTLGRSVDAYSHIGSILVYPAGYLAPDAYEDEAGVVTEELDDREGEAWERGTVVLSWLDILADARRMDGRNLVLHEFSHQIDLLDFLESPSLRREEREKFSGWKITFESEYGAFCDAVDGGRRDRVLDEYGAEDPSEFFAVSTEAFFERPAQLLSFHPALYGLLKEYYNQDPATWPLPPQPEAARTSTKRDSKSGKRSVKPGRKS